LLDAIHAKTNKGYHAFEIWEKFDKPHEETWECCPAHKFPVTPVIAHKRNETIFVISHFKTLGQHCPTGESDKHRKAKTVVAALVENKEIEICYDNFIIPFKNLEYKEKPKIPFRWEEIKVGNRRGDVVFDFIGFNSILGKGIVFEIQLSNITSNEIRKRERDWCNSGYSFAWITEKILSDDGKGLLTNKISLSYLFAIKLNNHLANVGNQLKDLSHAIHQRYQERMEEIEELKHELMRENNILKRNTCRSCKYGGVITEEWMKPGQEGMQNCWYGFKIKVQKHPDKVEPTSSCHNFKIKQGGEENARTNAVHQSN
jgi:hypothetical protein